MNDNLVHVDADNLAKEGFFCYMSKRKNPGWHEKAGWLESRFKQGLSLTMLRLPERGFIEYLPAEAALRPVLAKGYLLIHCLWVVGKSKGKGHAKTLLHSCLQDARERGFKGVAMVASDIGYMKWKPFLLSHGFRVVDTAPHSYELLALSFDTTAQPAAAPAKAIGKAALPRFCGDWESKALACGSGLTILKTRQCPYFHDFTDQLAALAAEKSLAVQVVELPDAAAVRKLAPTPYGTYNVVLNGQAVPIFYDAPKVLRDYSPPD